jgi:DtxR family Mn-dependent transcriptional regulator
MENYLKVIFEILEHEDRATTSTIAETMGIAAPSVTSMLKKLNDLGLVSHEPYRGVRLTEVGEKMALEIVRHHRLIELYLAEALGVPWDRVHEEAEKLEHVISEDLERRMAAALGDPKVDPHGSPIPALDGTLERVEAHPLDEATPGTDLRVVEVDDRDPEFLRYLARRGLFPGTCLTLLNVEPFGGPLKLRSDNGELTLGRPAAGAIRVSTLEEAPTGASLGKA